MVEGELLRRVQAGDGAAFDRLFALHRAGLHAFLLRLTGRRVVAEDLLQETWLRFVRAAPRLSADQALRPWLFRVARNLAIDERRRRPVEPLDRWGPEAGSPDDPHALYEGAELRRRLESALLKLPPAHREVVLLVAIERMDAAEIGDVLALSPVAVRKRISRARSLLREALGELGHPLAEEGGDDA